MAEKNIYNPSTGQEGYQVPGTTLPAGWVARSTTPAATGTPVPYAPIREAGAASDPGVDTSDPFVSRMSKDKADFDASLPAARPEPTLEAITANKRAAAQGQADLITGQFNDIIATAQKEGDKRAQVTKSQSRANGLSGSNIADANANQTAEDTQKIIETDKRERDDKINAILAGVDERASDQYDKERTNFLTENKDRQDRIDAFNKNVQSRVVNEFASIAAAGMSYDEFKTAHPDAFAQLVDESGLSEDGVKAQFIVNAPKGTIVNQDKPVIANGKATYFVQKTDPKTGLPTFSQVSVNLPEGYKDENIKQIVPRDDGIYVLHEDGSYQVIGKPNTSSSGGNLTDGLLTASKDEVDQFKNILKTGGTVNDTKYNGIGADGYVDPDLYTTLYTQWRAKGGTPAGFVKQFPLDVVNPESRATLPTDLLGANTKSGTAGGP